MKPPRLTLRQLHVFSAIAGTGTTAAAGQKIGLSQSATSAALTELERLLGVPVFDRAGRRLLLNATGRVLLAQARALLDAAGQIEHSISSESTSPANLRMGASTTIGNYVLPHWLARHWGPWLNANPQPCHARVTVGNTADIALAVADFQLDFGLIEGPFDHTDLQGTRWIQDQLVIVAAPERVDRMTDHGKHLVRIETLRQQVWLLRERGSGTRAITDQHLLPMLKNFSRHIELGNSEAIKHAAAEDMGLACLSDWVVGDWLRSGKLVRVRSTLPPIQRQWQIIVHRHKQISVELAQLMADLTKSIAHQPQ